MERLTRTDQPTTTPLHASVAASALVLVLGAACVFLAACSEQLSSAPQSQEGAQQEMVFHDVKLATVFSDAPYTNGSGVLRSSATGQPIEGAQVFYAAGGKTDTTTTNEEGRFGLQRVPLNLKRLQLVARHEGKKGTYEIAREKTFGHLAHQRKRKFERRQKQDFLNSDFRLALKEITVNSRKIQVSKKSMNNMLPRATMLPTPTAYISVALPERERLVISDTSFANAREAVVVRGQTLTFTTDEIDLMIKTRVPILKEGGTQRLWGRYNPDYANPDGSVGVGSGSHISSPILKTDQAMSPRDFFQKDAEENSS